MLMILNHNHIRLNCSYVSLRNYIFGITTYPKDDVVNFFGYYLERMYETDRGKELLAQIENEERSWKYLNEYKARVKFPY